MRQQILKGAILNGGDLIQSIIQSMFDDGIQTTADGLTITDPVEKADQIIKTANEIKKMAIQYQALTKLEDKVIGQNKKAVDSEDSLATDSL